MKKILIYFVLFGLLTACSNNSDGHSSNVVQSTEPESKPTETLINDNNHAPTHVEQSEPVQSIPEPSVPELSEPNRDDSSSQSKDITSLIPTGWKILESNQPARAEGDLNKDGIQDIAIVIENTADIDARSLLIAFGTKENTYSLSIIADHVILPVLDGGGYGDPFDGLVIDRGSIVVSDFGGGMERRFHKNRFRFQENDWYLIGATSGSNHTIKEGTEMAFDTEDYNLLTGDYIISKIEENGEERITKGNRGKKKLVKLSEFISDDM